MAPYSRGWLRPPIKRSGKPSWLKSYAMATAVLMPSDCSWGRRRGQGKMAFAVVFKEAVLHLAGETGVCSCRRGRQTGPGRRRYRRRRTGRPRPQSPQNWSKAGSACFGEYSRGALDIYLARVAGGSADIDIGKAVAVESPKAALGPSRDNIFGRLCSKSKSTFSASWCLSKVAVRGSRKVGDWARGGAGRWRVRRRGAAKSVVHPVLSSGRYGWGDGEWWW